MADLGTDLSCVSDCTPDFAEATGRLCLAQAVARRLLTPRGGLVDDPNYGFDLTGYVNDDVSTADLARIQANTEAECLKDERVEAADVTLSVSTAGLMIGKIILTDSVGPFTLVLSIDEVTVSILKVGE